MKRLFEGARPGVAVLALSAVLATMIMLAVNPVPALAVKPEPAVSVKPVSAQADLSRYHIRNAAWPNMCLDATSWEHGDGARVFLWGCNDSAANRWSLYKLDNGSGLAGQYMIVNTADLDCLDNDLGNRRHVQRWDCINPLNPPSNQRWWIVVNSGCPGCLMIYNDWSNLNLDAELSDDGRNGNRVQMYNTVGLLNQRWILTQD